jgi:hypothetical protein
MKLWRELSHFELNDHTLNGLGQLVCRLDLVRSFGMCPYVK